MGLFLRQVLYLLGKDKSKLPLLILIFIVASILELIGISLIGPYIGLLLDAQGQSETVLSFIEYMGLPTEKKSLLILGGCALFFVFAVKTIFSIWINKVLVQFSERQHVRLKSLLMSTYQSIPYIEYTNRNSAEYIYSTYKLTGQYFGQALMPLLRLISDGTVVLFIVIFLAWQNPIALSVLVLLLLIVGFIYDSLFRAKMYDYGAQINHAAEATIQGVNEGIQGLKEVRVLGREGYFHQKVVKNSSRQALFAVKSALVSLSLRYLLELTMIIFVVFLVTTSLFLGNDIDSILPTLSIFAVASLRLFPAMNTLMQSTMLMRLGQDSVSRLYNDLKQINREERTACSMSQDTLNYEEFDTLTLKKVCFSYPMSAHDALHNISLRIQAGESIGFIGASGSGKTTLLDTLLGLFTHQKGVIEYNGRSLGADLNEWRSQVAYIPQQAFLIDDSLKRNVALGIDDKEVDEYKLYEALRQARLLDLVETLPKGVDTILGEGGIRFSGGQRQRVALARAFYNSKNVFIMDEATSALDNATEAEIVNELQVWKGKKTLVFIAHRLTTLKHCDRIYELRNGKVIREGSYAEIIEFASI